jgi:hypothetical protein
MAAQEVKVKLEAASWNWAQIGHRRRHSYLIDTKSIYLVPGGGEPPRAEARRILSRTCPPYTVKCLAIPRYSTGIQWCSSGPCAAVCQDIWRYTRHYGANSPPIRFRQTDSARTFGFLAKVGITIPRRWNLEKVVAEKCQEHASSSGPSSIHGAAAIQPSR